MDSRSRYEILDTIAQGDFGKVCRARDRALGREVAVKQIHAQFLHDERQLARFWQEAQLLATLQHPNIITIYDVDRQRGWLIVELMRGNLQQFAHGEPIDLEFLRVALGGCLNALQFLHSNGVIHGDIKPSNILLDSQGRVKLGDFGLARRASNEGGSLLKGTTKYMAPELVSNQFGPVGPASDLYSLGFSAYELMCGSQFESLFPGLASFGRDRQIAWMMWHAAPDRQLPDIHRVLEGVPPDLAQVVQRLISKDQSRRYPSAAAVLQDLRTDLMAAPPLPQPQEDAAVIEAQARAAQKKKRMRMLAVGALMVSVVLSVMLLLPKPKPEKVVKIEESSSGVVTNVYPDELRLAIKLDKDGKAKELPLNRHDRVFVNDESKLLRDVLPDDHITTKEVRDDSGRRILEVRATRPVENAGTIKELKPDEDQFTLLVEDAREKGKELVIVVPAGTPILFNGKDKIGDSAVALADLQGDDRAVVAHKGDGDRRKATSIKVQRVVTESGVVRDVDLKKKTIALDTGDGGKPVRITLPFSDDCEVTINKQLELNERRLKPADLLPGDRAVVAHDTRITRIDAHRILGEAGVIQRVQLDSRVIDVMKEGGSGPTTTYQIDAQCKVTVGGETVDLAQLRTGDAVDIQHDTPGAKVPHATSVSAVRSADRSRWAILIGTQSYEDVFLTRLAHPLVDVKMFQAALTSRYQVPADQCLTLTDESLVRLEQSIPDRFRRMGPEAKVLVYCVGHAYKDDEGAIYLAPKNFDLKRTNTTGLALQWLVDQFEECPAKEKLLLLDCTQGGDGSDLARQPSAAEMIRTLKAPPGQAPLRTITVVASCKAGQRGKILGEAAGAGKGHGLFAWALAEGYRGQADKNRDSRIEMTELYGYLTGTMAAAGAQIGGEQAPELFLPDNRPPRLTEDAKVSIRKLAALLRQDKVDSSVIDDQYVAAASLAGKEVEPKVLYGLLLMKAKQRDKAQKLFEELKLERPKLLAPQLGIAWLRFFVKRYKPGMDDLIETIQRLPKPQKAGETYSEDAMEAFAWAGRLREFVSTAEDKSSQPHPEVADALDAAVKDHGSAAVTSYEAGRAAVRARLAEFDRQIGEATSEADLAKLRIERRRIVHYVDFPYIKAAGLVLAGMKE